MSSIIAWLEVILGMGLIVLTLYLTVSLVKGRGIREAMYGWGTCALNLGFLLTFLSIPLHVLFNDLPIPLLSLVVISFQMIGGLSILWGLFYHSHEPKKNMLLFVSTFMGGSMWTVTVIRAIEGDVFLRSLVNGNVSEISWQTQLFGGTILLLAFVVFILVYHDVKERWQASKQHQQDRPYMLILGIAEIAIIVSIAMGGLALVLKNSWTIPLFILSLAIVICSILSAQIILQHRLYLLFPMYLKIIDALDGEKASLG